MSVTTLWSKCQYAKCFGHWLVSDPECVRCAIADNCEKRTKSRVDDEKAPDDESIECEPQKQITPLDYMLQILTGKFEHETDEKDKAVIHKFRQNGRTVLAVIIGAYGKIKIMSLTKNKEKIFGKLGSIEEVELVLAEML